MLQGLFKLITTTVCLQYRAASKLPFETDYIRIDRKINIDNSKVKISHGNAENKINLFNQLPARKAKIICLPKNKSVSALNAVTGNS